MSSASSSIVAKLSPPLLAIDCCVFLRSKANLSAAGTGGDLAEVFRTDPIRPRKPAILVDAVLATPSGRGEVDGSRAFGEDRSLDRLRTGFGGD